MKFLSYLFIALVFSSAHGAAYEDYFRAVELDDDGTVAALIARGFDPNAPAENGQTGLHLALRSGATKVAKLLIEQPGLRPDTPNAAGETPLMLAALHGRYDACVRLIERGAKPHRSGWSPIHYAATGPDPKIVSLLLDLGAPVDAESPNRTTPLMMAARYGNEASARLLLGRGASAKLRNDRDLSAADFARMSNRTELAKLIDDPAAR